MESMINPNDEANDIVFDGVINIDDCVDRDNVLIHFITKSRFDDEPNKATQHVKELRVDKRVSGYHMGWVRQWKPRKQTIIVHVHHQGNYEINPRHVLEAYRFDIPDIKDDFSNCVICPTFNGRNRGKHCKVHCLHWLNVLEATRNDRDKLKVIFA